MPLLDLFWTMIVIFLFFAWIWVLIAVLGDIFRSDDLGGFAKAMWILFLILFTPITALVYVIVRGSGMTERNLKRMADQEKAARAYIQDAAQVSPADELAKLAELHRSGVLSDDEFAAQKAKLLA
jgi:hypothetical protein